MEKEWFEEEDFWINYAPIMFDDARWAEAPAVAQKVMELANLKEGDTILDCGCGLGRLSVEFAALGLKTTGIDIIQSELDAAKESAEAEGVELELINQDLRYFHTDRKFDCSVNLYTSFGYCDTIEEDMEILKNMCAPVKKGGTFILECVSRETAILYFTPGEEFERAGFNVKTEFSVVGAWEGLKSRWTLYPLKNKAGTSTACAVLPSAKLQTVAEPIVGQNKAEATVAAVDHCFVQRLYPASFLRDKLLEFGFSEAFVYGDYDKSPYNEKAQTMVVVGRK